MSPKRINQLTEIFPTISFLFVCETQIFGIEKPTVNVPLSENFFLYKILTFFFTYYRKSQTIKRHQKKKKKKKKLSSIAESDLKTLWSYNICWKVQKLYLYYKDIGVIRILDWCIYVYTHTNYWESKVTIDEYIYICIHVCL